jgi:Phage replication protein CRI
MIDWFTGYVGYDASRIVLGRFYEVDRNGAMIRDRDRWETAQGSYESGVQVTKAAPSSGMIASSHEHGFLCAPQVLQISGNPIKYLQGHNVTGPSVAQLGPVVQGLVRAFPEELRPHDADSLVLPAVHRSRVDVNTLVDMGSHQAVHDWLMLAETKTRSRHGRAVNSDGTVYWGQHSTRWAMKAYCKHCELKKHPPADSELLVDLLEWTRPFLRIELVLRRPELKNRGQLDESIIWEFFAKLELHTMRVKTYSEAKSVLPTGMKLALGMWYAGTDLKSFLPERTFRRHRKEILAVTGIDVAMAYADQQASAAPVLLGMDELFKREVKEIPHRIQRSLFGAGV